MNDPINALPPAARAALYRAFAEADAQEAENIRLYKTSRALPDITDITRRADAFARLDAALRNPR